MGRLLPHPRKLKYGPVQGFFKQQLLDIKSWLSTKAHSCCHNQAALLPSCGGSHRKRTVVNLPSFSKGGCARQAGCRLSQGRPHGRDRSISWGQQEGSRSKLCWRSSPQGVAVPCGHSTLWPRCTGTHHAEPSCCPPLLNLCVLSSAPAHASTGTHM